MTELLGYTAEEMIGRRLDSFMGTSGVDVFKACMEPGNQGAKEENDFEFLRKDGLRIHTRVAACPMMADGSCIGALAVVTDMTTQKRVEEQLRESEERWHFALEGAGDGVWDWNKRTNRVFFSQQWKAMLGFEDHEIGDTLDEWDKRVHPEDKERAYIDLKNHFDGHTPVYVNEHRILCKDGAYNWVLARGKVISRTSEGKPLRVIGTHTDITERKRAEDDLRTSEERYRLIFNHAPLGIIHFDQLGVVQDLNDKFAEMTGAPKEKHLGFNMLERVHDPAFLQAVEDAIGSGSGYYEGDYVSILGRKTTPLRAIYKRINAEDGKFLGAVGIFEDITERKLADKELKDSEQQLRSMIQGYPIPAFVIGTDHQVVYWNKALEQMSKINANEVVGTNRHWRAFYSTARPCMADLLVDVATPEAISHWYGGISNKSSFLEEAYEATDFFPELDGNGKWLHFTAAAIRNSLGDLVGAIETVEDVTARKNAEAALRESEERFRRFADEVTSEGIIVHDEDYILDVNEKFAAMYGYERSELIGTVHFKTLAPSDRELVKSKIQQKDEHPYEAVALRKDGSTFPIEIRIRTIPLRGKMVRAGAVRDLTDQKRAEDALISANRQLNDIIEFLPDATVVIDRDKKIIAWNRALEEMTGVSKKEMIGKGDYACMVPFYGERRPHLLDLIDAPDEELESRYQHVTRKGGILHAETYVPSLHGGEGAYVFATGAPLYDAHGNRVGAIESIRDITEQKQAVGALRESRQQLSDIINFLPDATFVIDTEGKVIAWNRAMEEMTGIRAAAMLGKGNFEYALPFYGERRPILIDIVLQSQPEIEQQYAAVERMDTVISGEAYMPALGGGGVYHLGKASALFDSKGNVVGAIESIRDITERKQAEDALKRTNILLFTQKEASIDGILAVDENDTIISSNQRFADMWSISREVVEGEANAPVLQSVSDKVIEPQAFLQRVGYLYAHRNETSLEEIALKDDRTFERYSAPMNGTDGRYYGRVWYFRDITDRKLMEKALMEAEAKYRGIFENSVTGIFQAIPEGRFISLNKAFARILGYDSPEEVLNAVSDISRQLYVHPDRRSELLRLIEERGTVQDFEVQLFKQDKSVVWITLNMRAVGDRSGKIIHLEGTAQDITDSKILASRLNQAQKMEAIGTLAGGIAHDFNNILAPIIGYSEISLNAVPEGSRLHHNIEQILVSGNRAKDLVKQILAFSRKTEPERRPVQVSLIIKETVKLLRSSLPSTIEIRQELDEDAIDSSVTADPSHIHQVADEFVHECQSCHARERRCAVHHSERCVCRRGHQKTPSGPGPRILP
jgi:PAS domain S-box-containing protein